MDFDPLTEAFPTRTTREDEEQEAENNSDRLFDDPLICWSSKANNAFAPGATGLETLIVAIGQPSCTLLHFAVHDKEVIGCLALPEISFEGISSRPGPDEPTCYVYSTGPGALRTAVVLCQAPVPPERSHAWAAALLRSVRPRRTVVLASAAPGEAQVAGADDAAVFALETDEWRRAAPRGRARPVQPLPSGSVVGGLPAKILGLCQAKGWPACALLLRQPTPSPDASSVRALHDALEALLKSRGELAGSVELDGAQGLSAAFRHIEARQRCDGVTGSVYL
uniref:Fatty acid desaturase n=1 Tax=Tetraselmis sp. GSL018 TaxID=582737 RepID=A0A061S8M8_9CHLO|mmetsp:Transcript_13196/g.31245  ORF Transcript_13196/g.31245 Transcript_13196/m.31245 type:complete len:281 (+) Transcript_13196:125-967(+)|eukprot:CAMPEP_0177590952 /NCGR_PEP_ID=MMETSP0419_2-20121207/7706_1 /TAXON_ID=582737 /ORGANISM="Tetraselmis sp., Strain GSL018" /LENGTH=280 /DNA_ID=CAMNT_0019081597 /DNA_START=40 /DNA_END=882 /DNA_ORIENTATION=-